MNRVNTDMIRLISQLDEVREKDGFLRKLVGLVGGSESFNKKDNTLINAIFDADNIRFSDITTLNFYHGNKSELLEYAVTCSDRLDCDSIVEMLIEEDQHNWLTDFDLDSLAQALYDQTDTHHTYVTNYFVRLSAQKAYSEYHQNIKSLKSYFCEDFKVFLEDANSVHINMIIQTAAIFGGTENFVNGADDGIPAHHNIDANDPRFSDKKLVGMLAANAERTLNYAESNAIWSGLFGQDHMIGCLLKEDDTTGYLDNISAKAICKALRDNTDSNHEKVAGYLMRLLMQRVCDYYCHQVREMILSK